MIFKWLNLGEIKRGREDGGKAEKMGEGINGNEKEDGIKEEKKNEETSLLSYYLRYYWDE